MLSYQVEAFGRPLSRVLRDLPQPQGSEVVLKVGCCGVCHSDVHLHDGYFSLGGDAIKGLSAAAKESCSAQPVSTMICLTSSLALTSSNLPPKALAWALVSSRISKARPPTA